jgi:hypothetical protein
MCRINAAVPGAAILRHSRSNSFRKQETALNPTRLLLWYSNVLADCRQCHWHRNGTAMAPHCPVRAQLMLLQRAYGVEEAHAAFPQTPVPTLEG